MVYGISKSICFLISKLFFRLKAVGVENIPKSGGFILASNHLSLLDPPLVGANCPRKLFYMARHDLFLNPLFSYWMRSVGAFPVKRESADLSALKQAMRLIGSGKGLLVFPEGRRGLKDSLKPQAGVGFLASKLNVPVIPAFIKGTEKAMPKGAKMLRPVKVTVSFGRKIEIERSLPYQEIANVIMGEIRELGKRK